MSAIRLDVHSRAPFAAGVAFGAAGRYERIEGTLHFAVDPGDAANRGIVDLERAQRGQDGRVYFQSDVCLLRPEDPARGSRRLLLEVPNRGRKGALARFNRPRAPVAPEGAGALGAPGGMGAPGAPGVPGASGGAGAAGEMEIGDGLLLTLGWTVAWCGWQWDVMRDSGSGEAGGGLLGFQAPAAVDDAGRPIQGQVMLQWQLDEPAAEKLLADRVHQPYPAARLDEGEAVLCTREWPDAPRVEIPRGRWRFAREVGGTGGAGGPVADETHVWLAGGFQAGRIYELTYTSRVCPVVGAGLLALRDAVGFLRYGGTTADGNPCVGQIDYTFGFGSSQCGRLLRHFLYLGLNVDESGRKVFDGVMINAAGARRGEFNHRYAQPSVITIPSFGHLPPFGFEGEGEASSGLLSRQRARGGVPKILATNTSSEYWNREASLLHTDVAGTRDVEPPDDVRIYHFAGTKHGPGSLDADEGAAPGMARGAPRANTVDFTPLLRAALFSLTDWVVSGATPPPSAFPRLADGTAAAFRDVLAGYGGVPGVPVVDPERLYVRRRLDLGPDAEEGVGYYPAGEGEPYPWFVPAVDADGNERAGIRLPDVAVPAATHTGWMARRSGTGGEGQNIDMAGATIPFAPDAAARRVAGDPRPAIAERYGDRAEYVARARAAAEQLVAEGYLLSDDVELVVQNATARYDAFIR